MKKPSRYKAVAITALLLTLSAILALFLFSHREQLRSRMQTLIKPDTVVYNGKKIRYSATFHDLQDVQMEAARQFGLAEMPHSRDEVEEIKGTLVPVRTNRYYKVAKLTHSVPYLRPNAARELKRIGKNFQDSLKSKDLPLYRIIVTSVLRTGDDVRKLGRSNSNASSNSTHCYGTTFDIWYAGYDRRSVTKIMDQSDLRKVLAEVLKDEKDNGRIWVRYESKQHCFHITCRY